MNKDYWNNRYRILINRGNSGNMSLEANKDVIDFQNKIKKYLKKKDKALVVDFGCGTGKNTEWLINHYKPRVYIGFDMSEIAIDYCAKKYPKQNFDVFNNKLMDFDVMWASFVFQHIEDETLLGYLKLFKLHMNKDSVIYSVNAICKGSNTDTMFFRDEYYYKDMFKSLKLKCRVLSKFDIKGSECALFEIKK